MTRDSPAASSDSIGNSKVDPAADTPLGQVDRLGRGVRDFDKLQIVDRDLGCRGQSLVGRYSRLDIGSH